ncbi:MAG: hypothetical protein WCD66_08895 [Rhodanobacteraceae bacterium]
MKGVFFVGFMFLFGTMPALGGPADGNGGNASGVTRNDVQGSQVSGPNALTSNTLSNPYCYQPDPQVNECVINIRYAQITDNQSTSPYMLRWVVSINSKVRLVENLFFEGTVYFSYDMAPTGLKVPCGSPDAGGGGMQYGNQYLVKAEPLDTSGASMGYSQAILFCPAFSP